MQTNNDILAWLMFAREKDMFTFNALSPFSDFLWLPEFDRRAAENVGLCVCERLPLAWVFRRQRQKVTLQVAFWCHGLSLPMD